MSRFKYGATESLSGDVVEIRGEQWHEGLIYARLLTSRAQRCLVIAGQVKGRCESGEYLFSRESTAEKEVELVAGQVKKLTFRFQAEPKPWAVAVFPSGIGQSVDSVLPAALTEHSAKTNVDQDSTALIKNFTVRSVGADEFYISFDCPRCGRALVMQERKVPNHDECPQCNARFLVDREKFARKLEERKSRPIKPRPEERSVIRKVSPWFFGLFILVGVTSLFRGSSSIETPFVPTENVQVDGEPTTTQPTNTAEVSSNRRSRQSAPRTHSRRSTGMTQEEHQILLAYVASQYPRISLVEQNELVVLLWTLKNDEARRMISKLR